MEKFLASMVLMLSLVAVVTAPLHSNASAGVRVEQTESSESADFEESDVCCDVYLHTIHLKINPPVVSRYFESSDDFWNSAYHKKLRKPPKA